MSVPARAALPAYTAGTVSANAGQPVLIGNETSWTTTDASGNVVSSVTGGDLFITATGPIPIRSVDNASQITLECNLPSALAAGTAYRILKISPNLTGAVSNMVTMLQAQGTDTQPDLSRTIDNGASRIKLRVGADGNGQLSVGQPGAADAALLTALDINFGTGVVSFPNGYTASQLIGKNSGINTNFGINQRLYASGATLAAGIYGHDRYKAGSNGCAYTFTQSTTDTVVSITAGSLIQAVDAPNVYASSFWLTWSGSASVRVWQGSASGNFSAGTPLTIDGTTVNSLLVSNLVIGSVTSIEWSIGTLGTTRPWQFEAAIPNVGPARYERRHGELALCQRYAYVASDADNAGGAANGAATPICRYFMPVDLRAAPSVSLLLGGSFYITDDYASNYSTSSVSLTAVYSATPRSTRLQLSGFSNLTIGRLHFGGAGSGSGTARLLLSAEL